MSASADSWPYGERAKQARGHESQRAVAKRAGIPPETLFQIEEGYRRDGKTFMRPRVGTLLKHARAVGIPDSEALTLAGYDPAHHVQDASPEEDARKLAMLPADVHRSIMELVDGYLVAKGLVEAGGLEVASAGESVRSGVQSHGEPVQDRRVARRAASDD